MACSVALILASKGLISPGSPSMFQGGSSLGSPRVAPIKMADTLSCRASMPACGVPRGAYCGQCLHSHGSVLDSPKSFCNSNGGFCGGVPSMPMSFHDGGGGGLGLHLPTVGAFCSGGSGSIPSPCHASLFAQRSNASGCAVVAFTALPASLMLAVPSVGAGEGFVSNDTPPGSYVSMTAHLMGSVPTLSAM